MDCCWSDWTKPAGAVWTGTVCWAVLAIALLLAAMLFLAWDRDGVRLVSRCLALEAVPKKSCWGMGASARGRLISIRLWLGDEHSMGSAGDDIWNISIPDSTVAMAESAPAGQVLEGD